MNYGFIGLGNMAGAILAGMAASGNFSGDVIYGFNRSEGKTLALQKSAGLKPCGSAAETAERADVLVLAVKPQVMPKILEETAGVLKPSQTVITIAAGKPLGWYEERIGKNVPVVRAMPNINAKVKSAVTAVCGGTYAQEEQIALAERVFGTVGKTYRIEESMFPAFSAIGGASGAFVFMYIDALADAGVRAGFPRKFAVGLAAETVLGSAKLAAETGEHPAALVNQVCSPGGTTIEGVLTLKRLGFESAVHQGIEAIIEKDRRLAK